MRALIKWMADQVFRRRVERIWTHVRHSEQPEHDGEIWWHVELAELDNEFHDIGQRRQAMAWCSRKTVYSGYGPSLAEALKNALRRAKEGRPDEWNH